MADVVSEDTRGRTYADIQGLQPWVIKQLNQLKIHQPTPIQYHCIQPALEGKDVIGAAKTGSGKTLAFVIPILQRLSIDPYGIYALVLTPTRELAFQIADQFRALGAPVSLRLSVVVGGLDIVVQGAELNRSPHVVVSTPGRLADILETSPEFTLKRIKFLVLDEADRLMDGRFDSQLHTIWSSLPEKRQTLLFSATITDRLERMKELASSEVFLWQSSGNKQATVQQLDERYALVNPIVKDATMIAMVLQQTEQKPRGLIMIFTDTCKNTQVLSMLLNSLSIECVALHSMLSQKERLSALARFKSSQVKVLIATDVASRGLDIPLVDEAMVRKIMKQVNVSRREQEIRLEQTDFDERRNINKRKRLILEGRDPDEEEKKKRKHLKKLRKAERQERNELLKHLEKKTKWEKQDDGDS
nr:probable ATP-dependent RNA helicase DDX49 isoform X2 [Cherax quadricarinatus]